MDKSNILYDSVRINKKYGYYELSDEFRKELDSFYEDEYYQNEHAVYHKKPYEKEDVKNKRFRFAQKEYIYRKNQPAAGGERRSFMDIGAGEGYALAFFNEQNWDVTGIDFSSFGMENHNPELLPRLLKGDLFKIISELANEGKSFDFINADNLLEHLPKPEEFFKTVKKISNPDTVLCVSVPNDFSIIQKLAFEKNKIEDSFWVSTESSEHFSYFSVESLCALGKGMGFTPVEVLGEWPIDFFLLHDKTNYRVDGSVGHDCHMACVWLENLLNEESMEKAVNLNKALGYAGIGRNICVFFKESIE